MSCLFSQHAPERLTKLYNPEMLISYSSRCAGHQDIWYVANLSISETSFTLVQGLQSVTLMTFSLWASAEASTPPSISGALGVY